MAFYRSSHRMSSQIGDLLNQIAKKGRIGLHKNIAITWIRYQTNNPEPGCGRGTSWSGEKLVYPASVVKLIYAVAAEVWQQNKYVLETPELRRALHDMICDSSNDATSLVVDLLSGTTSGPSMIEERWEAWQKQRQVVNEWLATLNWEEVKLINCCQKTWSDGPYGREKEFYKDGNTNRNAMTTKFTARILEAVMTNGIASPPACKRLRALLERSLDYNDRKSNPDNQIDGFIGEGLPRGTKIWSKAGWMSQVRNDAAWLSLPNSNPMLLIVFTQGRQYSNDEKLLPELAKALFQIHLEDN